MLRLFLLPLLLRWLSPALLAVFFLSSVVMAANGDIYVVLSSDSNEYRQVSDQIVDGLRASHHARRVVHTLAATALDPAAVDDWPVADAAVVVAVGMRALRRVIEGPGRFPVFAVLVPHASYHRLIDGLDSGQRRRLSVLYLDQPPQRQLKLAAALDHGLHSVGILLHEETFVDVEALDATARRIGLRLEPVRVAGSKEVVQRLKRVKRSIDLLITVFDPQITTAQTVKRILYFSYHRRLPVIGYSSAMVRAGALAAVYSEAWQIGLQAAETLVEAFDHQPLQFPDEQFPRYFQASCNAAVWAYFNFQSRCDLSEFSNPGEHRGDGGTE